MFLLVYGNLGGFWNILCLIKYVELGIMVIYNYIYIYFVFYGS